MGDLYDNVNFAAVDLKTGTDITHTLVEGQADGYLKREECINASKAFIVKFFPTHGVEIVQCLADEDRTRAGIGQGIGRGMSTGTHTISTCVAFMREIGMITQYDHPVTGILMNRLPYLRATEDPNA